MQLYDPCTTMFFFRNKVRHSHAARTVLWSLVKPSHHAKDCAQEQSFTSSPICITMFALCLQHIMIDLGTGNNNKVNWAMTDKQEFIDIVEVVYRGARKGRGLVVSVDPCGLASVRSTVCGTWRPDANLWHAGITQRLLHKVPVLQLLAWFLSVQYCCGFFCHTAACLQGCTALDTSGVCVLLACIMSISLAKILRVGSCKPLSTLPAVLLQNNPTHNAHARMQLRPAALRAKATLHRRSGHHSILQPGVQKVVAARNTLTERVHQHKHATRVAACKTASEHSDVLQSYSQLQWQAAVG